MAAWGSSSSAAGTSTSTFDHLNGQPNGGQPCRSLYVLPSRTFGEAEALSLAKAMESNTTLEELYISGHSLGPGGAEALGAAIAGHPALRVLCVGDDTFGADMAGAPSSALLALCQPLERNRSLTALDFERKGLGPAGVTALVALVAVHPSITELKLAQNGFGCRGVQALAAASHFGRLEQLNLAANNIRSESQDNATSGATELSRLLRARGALTALDLSSNPLGQPATAEHLKQQGNEAFAAGNFAEASAKYVSAMHGSGDTLLCVSVLSNRAEVALRLGALNVLLCASFYKLPALQNSISFETGRNGAALHLARRALLLDPTHEKSVSREQRALAASAADSQQAEATALFERFAPHGRLRQADLSVLCAPHWSTPS